MTFEFVLKILLIIALVGTVGALAVGIFNLFQDGKKASERSNRMMRYRIFFQALAIAIFSLLLFVHGK